MEVFASAVTSDLTSRFISFLAERYGKRPAMEDEDLERRLGRVLLRIRMVVEEAEARHVTNQGMLLQLKALAEGMYLGFYVLDMSKCRAFQEGEQDRSFNPTKRLRLTATAAGKSAANLKNVLGGLEAKIDDVREFVMLLCSCPRLRRQPYSTYLFMDTCMFGRHVEKEQIICFLLHENPHGAPNLSVLTITGPPRVGKKTLVQHACRDERVRGQFTHVLFLHRDGLKNWSPRKLPPTSGKCLFIVKFSWDADEEAWKDFKSSLGKIATGSKAIIISRTEEVVKWGTARPIRLKNLSQEEYWYYFKALAFGSTDADEHPKLASLGMQLAAELNGSFLGASILGELLRANPSAQFWHRVLMSIREMVRKHVSLFGEHPEKLLEKNRPVDMAKVVSMSSRSCLVYDLREAGHAGQTDELPKVTSLELLMGDKVLPCEDKFDVLVWRSRIPPYGNYVATFVKQKPRGVVYRNRHRGLKKERIVRPANKLT